jgi:UDPglucose 6-dehydrogenase
MKETIGFIGQGWVGSAYAKEFEERGYAVVRYSLDPQFAGNRERIAACDIVFIAVPTPTTTQGGFDGSIVESVLPLVGEGKIAVVKSTLLPGTTEALQEQMPDRIVLFAPEFLRTASAEYDAANPTRTIIGLPKDTEAHRRAAERVLAILPTAPHVRIMESRAAEVVKYAGNVFLALKVVYANLLYDLTRELGLEYEPVREALAADPRIGPSHLNPIDASGHTNVPGRGVGGHCLIKDLEAFRLLYDKLGDEPGAAFLAAFVRKNNDLLTRSGKDLDLLAGVYGDHMP